MPSSIFGFALSPDLYDQKQGVKMGIPSDGCDDAKTNLEVDWDGDSVNYTCFMPSQPFWPNLDIESLLHCDQIPKNYYPSKFFS